MGKGQREAAAFPAVWSRFAFSILSACQRASRLSFPLDFLSGHLAVARYRLLFFFPVPA